MGADAFVVYFGLRFPVDGGAELEALERREDARIHAARKARLKTFFGRATEGEPYFLLVGTELGQFGIQGRMAAELSEAELRRVMEETKEKLRRAGLEGEPALHLRVIAQF